MKSENIFTIFRTGEENNRFQLVSGEETLTFYTSRSLGREQAALEQKISSLAPRQKLVYVAPYHEKCWPEGISPAQLVWISPASFSHPALNSILHTAEDLLSFSQNITADDKLVIDFHPVLRKSKAFEQISGAIHSLVVEGARRLKTIDHFANTWQYNWQRNHQSWLETEKLNRADVTRPDALVLGGYSVTKFIDQPSNRAKNLWCADTALAALHNAGFNVALVFSIDSGHGSFEHFALPRREVKELSIVLDALSFPQLYSIPFKQVYSYASSNPLLNQVKHHHDFLENKTGDVFGLMQACYEYLFPAKALPEVIGRDGKSQNGISHVRGSGYYRYSCFKRWRLDSTESYLYRLNSRY